MVVAAFVLATCSKAGSAHPQEPAVASFLDHYFASWSAKDMEAYGECFHPQARISFVMPNGEPHTEGLTDFLHGQKLSHAQTTEPMVEVPTDKKITMDSRVAHAAVRWRLTKGSEIVTGTDFFTLVKTNGGWRILSLVFYND